MLTDNPDVDNDLVQESPDFLSLADFNERFQKATETLHKFSFERHIISFSSHL